MPIPINTLLYNDIKNEANKIYGKPSAYKSGWIVKTYKNRGGIYIDDKEPKNLERWFKEKWGDIGNKEYPVYRPFKRINKNTPLTIDEIDPKQAKEQIKLKQIIKGDLNLPPFKAKGEGFINIKDVPKNNDIWNWSNPIQVRKMADKYLGKNIPIYISNKKNKKYMVQNPDGKWIYFGQFKPPMEDYTKHRDNERRKRYLARATKIKGNWKDNTYSPNNLSINLLWNG